jgi:hypothetical protein
VSGGFQSSGAEHLVDILTHTERILNNTRNVERTH